MTTENTFEKENRYKTTVYFHLTHLYTSTISKSRTYMKFKYFFDYLKFKER